MANYKFALVASSIRKLVALLVSAAIMHACSDQPNTPSTVITETISSAPADPSVALDSATSAAVTALIAQYLARIDSDFSAVQSELESTKTEIERLLESPDITALKAVRAAWLRAHSAYELTAVHRHFIQSVVNETTRLNLLSLEYQINHWPILPGYIDYLSSYPESGIVNDMTVPLTADEIRAQHGLFDINEAAVGFHTLEFLIWGENRDRLSPRPFTDFQEIAVLPADAEERGLALDELSNNRRRVMLALGIEILNQDFESFMSIWAAQSNDFRVRLENAASHDLLRNLLNALTSVLTEEVLARSLYPMLNGDFTDSFPSVFSHSSQNVVSAQMFGLEQLLLETSTESMTLDQILSHLSRDYAEYFFQNFDASKECLVLLFSTQEATPIPTSAAEAEFAAVECINQLTNMIDYVEQGQSKLIGPA
jgi:putative iron-regulated protein